MRSAAAAAAPKPATGCRRAGSPSAWSSATPASSATAALRPIDAGLGEGRHLAVQPAGLLDQRQREGGAAGLAEAQAQVEQRLEPELGEHERVGRLGRAVP